MAGEVGSTWLTVAANARGFGKSLQDQINGETQGIGSKVGKAFGTAFAAAGKAVIAGSAMVATGVGAIVTAGVKFNSAMEDYAAAFTPMLGSADAAKAKLEELTTFAAKTPFELTDVADASKTLLAFGRTSEDLIPDLKMLGDISQGNAQQLNSLTLAFGKMSSQTYMTGEDLNMMIDAGFNPMNSIIAKTGESVSEFRKRMERTGVSFDEVRSAMVDATSSGGQFYDTMELASQTLTGQLSNLSDGFSQLSGSLTVSLQPALVGLMNEGINPLLGGLKDMITGVPGAQAEVDRGAAGIVTAITGLGASAQTTVDNIKTVFGTVAESVGSAIMAALPEPARQVIQDAGDRFNRLSTSVSAALPNIESLAGPVLGLVGALSPLGIIVDALIAAIPNLSEIAASMGGVISDITPVVAGIVSGLSEFAAQVLGNETAVRALVGAFVAWKAVSLVAGIVSTTALLVSQGAALVGNTLNWSANTAAKVADKALTLAIIGLYAKDFIMNIVRSGAALVVQTGQWIANTAAKVADKAVTLAILALYAKDFIMNIVRSGAALVVQTGQWVANTAAQVASKVALVAGTVAMGAATAAQWLLNAAMNANPIGLIIVAVTALVAALVWFFTQTDLGREIWSGFITWLTSAWEWVKETAVAVWNAIASFLTGLWNGISSTATSVWNSIVSFVSGIPDRILAGLAFLAGLGAKAAEWFLGVLNAGKEKLGELVDWVKGIPGKVLDALGNLGSTLFNAGKSLIQGFINGIKNMVGNITDAVGGIMDKIRGFFPFSPAKVGAFSGRGYTTYSGKALTSDFADSIASGRAKVTDAVSRLAADTQATLTAGMSLVASAPSFTTEAGSASGPAEVRDPVVAGLVRELREAILTARLTGRMGLQEV